MHITNFDDFWKNLFYNLVKKAKESNTAFNIRNNHKLDGEFYKDVINKMVKILIYSMPYLDIAVLEGFIYDENNKQSR